VFLEIGVELVHLFLGGVQLLEHARDRVDREVAAFVALGDQNREIVSLGDRRLRDCHHTVIRRRIGDENLHQLAPLLES
jgi:hypothetical protein